ncbi:MAG TPA: L-threonylcarbamoyladenylate synthase [Terriglobales bacterium]|nr:L-threonylcarbamoyladenylate synthase [Terriglobales bacterium]
MPPAPTFAAAPPSAIRQLDFRHLQSVMPDRATTGEIDRAAQLLRAGRLVAFPTETVYGLGANALDADAVARIFAVKRRPATSPLIVHVASIEMARSLAAVWPEIADRLAQKFWPGPLTLVVEKQSAIPDIVTAGLSTVGLRMPAHPVAQALIKAAAIPLAAPSANRFTELSPTIAEHVRHALGSEIGTEVDCVLDGGPCQVGIESTVLSLVGPVPALLRPGAISRAELEAVVGPVVSATEVQSGPHPAPGMHLRHYSPRTKLFLVTDGKLPEQGRGIYLLHHHSPSRSDAEIHKMPQSAADYAAALYGVLHHADAGHYDWIAVELPPLTPAWEAIHDRLKRAATK